jgi:hypothetical protein
MWNAAYSAAFVGLGASANSARGGDDSMVTSSSGVDLGVGDWTSICAKYGCLCGSGEMSIRSFSPPGEEDGRGGVRVLSVYD